MNYLEKIIILLPFNLKCFTTNSKRFCRGYIISIKIYDHDRTFIA